MIESVKSVNLHQSKGHPSATEPLPNRLQGFSWLDPDAKGLVAHGRCLAGKTGAVISRSGRPRCPMVRNDLPRSQGTTGLKFVPWYPPFQVYSQTIQNDSLLELSWSLLGPPPRHQPPYFWRSAPTYSREFSQVQLSALSKVIPKSPGYITRDLSHKLNWDGL